MNLDFLKDRVLFRTKYMILFTDNGHPKFTYFPKFYKVNYKIFGIKGFRMYFFGREFNFSYSFSGGIEFYD